jgi:hypothetical protein
MYCKLNCLFICLWYFLFLLFFSSREAYSKSQGQLLRLISVFHVLFSVWNEIMYNWSHTPRSSSTSKPTFHTDGTIPEYVSKDAIIAGKTNNNNIFSIYLGNIFVYFIYFFFFLAIHFNRYCLEQKKL